MVTLLEEGTQEPLAHAIYREAWEQKNNNPRSALVLGMVAAEVGVKQCVSRLLPEVQWLVDNVPSPPIVSMIKNYLPLMPTKLKINGTVVPPPKEILRSLQQGVEARNRTIHIGAAPPNRDELKELLLSVKDLLYILDYYCGFDWALTNVRPHIQKELAV